MGLLRKLTNLGATSLGVITLLLVLTPKAYGVATLDFDGRGGFRGGTLTSLSGGGWSATGIAIGSLTISGAPTNNGTYDLTGAFVGVLPSGDPSAAVLDFTFDPVNNINFVRITGGLTIGTTIIPSNTVLVSGSFTTFGGCSIVSGTTATLCTGSGLDTKDASLLTAIGINPSTGFGFNGGSIGNLFGLTLATQSLTGESARLVNTQQTTSVPEPSTLLLLGAGLVGLAMWGRKRFSKTDKS